MAVFGTGRIVMTDRVAEAMLDDSEFQRGVMESLERHFSGDWGDVDEDSL